MYKAPVEEIAFTLKHVAGLDEALRSGRFGDLSADVVEAVLQEAGLVDIHKGYTGNRPLTEIHLTPAGRQRFLDYLSVLERVVRDASARAEQAAPGKPQVA